MQICKRFLLAVVAISGFSLYAQQSMPSMPTVSISDGPSMPRITAPTLGTRYYTPGKVNTNISNKASSQSESKSAENPVTVSNASAENQLKSMIGNTAISRLTASDVAGLGNDGLFGGIYGLLGNDSNLYAASTASSNNEVLLQTIMSQLDELKKQTAKNNSSTNKTNLPVTQSSAKDLHEFEPQVLRFYVNGYNILETMRTVYFSKKENDGSFLLTGDRRYTSDNKSREETFYLLFKADGNCGTSAGYYVEPQVVQDYKNEYSFLYQLTMKPELKAEKTGNLVSVKYVSPDWNMDLLLDIGDN